MQEVRRSRRLRRLLVQVHVAGQARARVHEAGQRQGRATDGGRPPHFTCKGRGRAAGKKPPPTLREFIDNRFEPWARGTFEKTSPKTWRDYYKVGIKAIQAHKPLADSRLDEITSELASAFAAHRQAGGRQVSTVNSSLQILRRILRLAAEWGVLDSRVPMIRMMPGERRREHVVSWKRKRLNIWRPLPNSWVKSRLFL